MAISLKTPSEGYIYGGPGNVVDYSVTEDAFSLNHADTTGGTGEISASATAGPYWDLLMDQEIEIEDGSNGKTTGRVYSAVNTSGSLRVSANSRLNLLVADRQTAPFVGTLGNALRHYFGLVGITSGIVIDAAINNRAVVFEGWKGDVWTFLKQVCASERIEISLVSNNVVARPVGARTLSILKESDEEISITNAQLARRVEVVCQHSQYQTDQLAYPTGGWNADVTVYQVDAGEVLEVELPVAVSLSSIVQPTCVEFVNRNHSSSSVYAVSGADGLPIMPAEWIADGGRLTAEIMPDTKTIKVRITGMRATPKAPYRIAMSAGPSDTYSSLRIIGSGVFLYPQTYSLPTGVPDSETGVEVGVVIESPTIRTLEQAHDALVLAAASYSLPNSTIRASASVVNRDGDHGQMNYATFADFDLLNAGRTFAQFDAVNAGKTIAQYDAEMTALVVDNFENQAFGNIAGARVEKYERVSRVRSATTTQDGISYTAETYTLFSDFDRAHAGLTFGQWDQKYAGMTFSNFAVRPLKAV